MTYLRKISVILSAMLLAVTFGCQKKAESVAPASSTAAVATSSQNTFDPGNFTDQQIVSYNMGLRMGMYVNQNQFNGFDLDALILGVKDGATQYEPRFSDERVQSAMNVVNDHLKKEQEAATAVRTAQGKTYMNENAAREGVIVTESGLQYKPLVSVAEGKSPTKDDTVTVHYRGTLIDGTEFDSSYTRGEPATFSLDRVIAGWVEVLQLMKPGEKWHVVMPPELAYGENSPSPTIPPNSVLVFEIELLSIAE